MFKHIFKPFLVLFILISIKTNIYCQNNIIIDPLSVRSLYLEQIYNSQKIARATGFVIEKESIQYLITNWHVLTGINPVTGDTLDSFGRTPNKIIIYHNTNVLGTWSPRVEDLYNSSGLRRWLEYPNGKKVDVVALPLLSIDSNIKIYPFDLNLAKTDMIPEVAMPTSIIGYPVGLNGLGNFPIWKTGHIASEPNLDYEGEPVFLIDATTRGGMSGSPVILRLKGGYRTKLGNRIMATTGYRTLFLGVYSGQWSFPEIGKVWKPIVIIEILSNISGDK